MHSLSDDAFWHYSCQVYGVDEVKHACLLLQDTYHANVNILLLCMYLDSRSQSLSSEQINALEHAIKSSESSLQALRQERKKTSKSSQLYSRLLQQELSLERRQQQILVMAANEFVFQVSGSNVMTYLHRLKHFDPSADLALVNRLTQAHLPDC